jgi:hypothetical protein
MLKVDPGSSRCRLRRREGSQLEIKKRGGSYSKIMATAVNTEGVNYDLTCWYLNTRRVMELLGLDTLASGLRQVSSITEISDFMAANTVSVLLKNAVTQWLRATNPPTLGQPIITETLSTFSMFTHYSNYFFRGLSEIHAALENGKTTVPMAEAYSKLDEFRQGQRLSFNFHHEHLVSKSAWDELSGQRRLLVLGAVKAISDCEIEAIPWVIANPLPNLPDVPDDGSRISGFHWSNRLEIFVDAIDSFERVRDIKASGRENDLEALRQIPEDTIKRAFADIIGEPTVPEDWGGERSDLFTSRVTVDGRRISAAFAFKGPAKFHPMTMADLGKQGDQINRLFSEPADLLVLQHCHEITPPVRGMMRAFAQQMGNPRLFCLINGYDTLRILQAYGKCGM